MSAPGRLAEFTNRTEELARLEQLLYAPTPRTHAALVGLRRSGKTVLLEEFAARHAADRIAAVVEADDAANGAVAWMHHVLAALVGATTRPATIVAPEPAAIRQAASGLDSSVRQRLEELLQLASQKKQDNYSLFAGPLRFGQQLAESQGREVVLAIDEFPEVLELKKLRGLNKLEATIRVIAEREAPQVFFVITGSAVRQMKTLLTGAAPLLTRFEQITMRPFTPEDAELLLDRLLTANARTIEPYARQEMLRWVQGHPFYLTKLTSRAARLAEAKSAPQIGVDHLHEAFQLEVIEETGNIARACAWIFNESLGPKGEGGRQLLLALARADNLAKAADLNTYLNWDRSKLSKQIEALVETELILRHGEDGESGYLAFGDPLFALWLARKAGKVGASITQTVPGLRKIVAQLSEQASTWYEAYTVMALANFDGKGWPGALFGLIGKREIAVPQFPFEKIEPNPTVHDTRGIVYGHPEDVEVDAYALGSEGWLVEVKAERTKATKAELAELERAARVFREDGGKKVDRLWFVAQAGFHDEAETYAHSAGIYITRGTQLREIRRIQVERSTTRKRAASKGRATQQL